MSRDSPTSTDSPYNTAYIQDDRNHLYVTNALNPAYDDGVVHPESGELTVPPDYDARRDAIVAFYGDRCGRCAGTVATTRPGDDETLAHVVSLGDYDDSYDRWELDALVPLCRPCYDLVAATNPGSVGRINSRFDRAPQFPSWVCDPRVAVERAPLTGEELWRRERLVEGLDCDHFDFQINDPVANADNLAIGTSASRAVALGEAYARNQVRTEPARGLDRRWEDLDERTRDRYERRVTDPETVLESGQWDDRETDRLPVGTAVDAVSSD